MKLRNRLRNWLLKEEFEEFNNKIKDMEMAYDKLEDQYRLVTDLMQVGVDHHVYNPTNNWAVICVGGKNEYVRFARFEARDMREVQSFLKRYEQKNTRIDSCIPTDLFWSYTKGKYNERV